MITLEKIQNRVQGVTYIDDCRADMFAIDTGTMYAGEDTGFPGCDQMFKWFTGHHISVGGHGNHGKSCFLQFLAVLKSVRDDQKWLFNTPESYPEAFWYYELMNCYSGKSPYPHAHNAMTDDEKYEARKWVGEHFFYCNPEDANTPKKYFELCRAVYEKYGVTGFVNDPFNKMTHDFGKFKFVGDYINRYITVCQAFAREINGYMVTVIHPGTGSYNVKDDLNIRCPNEREWEFGPQWSKTTDDAMIIHRPKKTTEASCPDVLLRITKNKLASLVGIGGDRIIQFSRPTRRYYYEGESGFPGDRYRPIRNEYIASNDFTEPQREETDTPF